MQDWWAYGALVYGASPLMGMRWREGGAVQRTAAQCSHGKCCYTWLIWLKQQGSKILEPIEPLSWVLCVIYSPTVDLPKKIFVTQCTQLNGSIGSSISAPLYLSRRAVSLCAD